MACDVQTLITAANCYSCGIIPGTAMYQAVKLALLCRIKDGVTMACDVQTLLDEAKCFMCGVPPGQLAFIELSLLCQIATSGGGGGGGGSGSVLQGAADPVAAPASPNSPAVYTNTTTGVIFSWSVAGQAWI